jgi:putative SOS response-associated peptidase YedK
MCGRYRLTASTKEMADLFDLAELLAVEPRYNIAPSQQVLTVRLDPESGKKTAALLKWGLVPPWSKDGKGFINARSDTAASKPTFRRALKKNRCLIAADGFYEWQKQGAKKQPYFIGLKGGRPFAFAGLWERWQGGEGEPVETCAILTTDANDLMQPIHNRMPVILDRRDFGAWLDPEGKPEELQALLHPYEENDLEAYPVSTFVNNPRNQGPQCAERAG